MASLTPQRRVAVRFADVRAAEGPMTLGQLNILRWFESRAEQGEPANATVKWWMKAGEDTRVADVAEAFAILLARHEGLRTVYVDGRRQRVAGAGELVLWVYTVKDGLDHSVDETLGRQLADRLAEQTYERATQLPVRVALAAKGDRVIGGMIEFSHLCIDRYGARVVGRELADLLADPAARCLDGRRHQPLDQAVAERMPVARRRVDDALRYWAGRLRRMPVGLYARDGNGAAHRTGARPRSEALQLSSPAAAAALHHIAARIPVSRPTAVLAAICAVLSLRTGYQSCIFPVVSSNRYQRRLADYVGTMAQSGLVEIEVGEAGFDELVARTWSAVACAGRYGYYDVYRLAEVTRRIEVERGVSFHDHEPVFNDGVSDLGSVEDEPVPVGDLAATAARSRLCFRTMPTTPALVRFDLWHVDGEVTLDLWTGDTDRVSREEMAAMLRAVERLLLAAAAADLDQSAMREVAGVEPITRGDGWLHVDGCWVELAQVQRLLEEAAYPARVRVFAEADGRRLVGYLAATESLRTPQDAHARCVAAVQSRLIAMTPRYYVVCEGAPEDRSDLAGWRRRPVVGQGTGRS